MLKLSFAERESISPPDLPADKEDSSLSQLLRPPARRSAHLETANSLHLDFKNTHLNDNLLEHLNLWRIDLNVKLTQSLTTMLPCNRPRTNFGLP